MDRLARFVRDRCLSRVSGHLWITHDVLDWDDEEPKDYYRAYFEDADGNPVSRLVQVRPDGLDVKLWDAPAKEFAQEDIAHRYLNQPLRLRRILKNEIEVRYNSEREFLLKDWWWPRTVQMRERLFQRAYERMSTIRAERLDVLRAILDQRLGDNDYHYILGEDTINSEQLAVKIFGRRALNREDGGRLFSRLDLILDSLLASSDIEVVGEADVGSRSFRATGQSITTVSQADSEDRRHRDTKFLTWVLIGVGALQVIAAAMQIQAVREWVHRWIGS